MGERAKPLPGWRVLSLEFEFSESGKTSTLSCERWAGDWHSTEIRCGVCSAEFALHYPAICEVVACPYCGCMTAIERKPDDPEPWRGEDAGPWHTLEVECAVCSYEFVSTYPESADTIECPKCRHATTAPHLLDGEDNKGQGDAWRETSDPSEAGDEP